MAKRDVSQALLTVVGMRYAAELLAELATRPDTGARVRRRLRAPGRVFAETLRGLAALGAVRRRGDQGTWDLDTTETATYELTSRGADWARQLDSYEVWVSICERYLAAQDTGEK